MQNIQPELEINIEAAVAATPVATPVAAQAATRVATQAATQTPVEETIDFDPTLDAAASLDFIVKPTDAAIAIENEKKKNKILQDMDEIVSIEKNAYQSFLTALNVAANGTDATDIISIKNGEITAAKREGILFCDLTEAFGELNWDISNPVRSYKILKFLAKELIDGEKVSLMKKDTNDEKSYIAYVAKPNGEIKASCKLPIPIFANAEANLVKYETPNEEALSKINVKVSTIKTLREAQIFAGGANYTAKLDETTGEIISISAPDGIFTENFLSEDGRKTIEVTMSTLFPAISTTNMEIEVHRTKHIPYSATDTQEWDYVLVTISDFHMTQFKYIIRVNVVAEGVDIGSF